MAKTTSFNLGDHFEQFISTQIKSGRYGNASEVVRASLRAMEQEEQKLKAFAKHSLMVKIVVKIRPLICRILSRKPSVNRGRMIEFIKSPLAEDDLLDIGQYSYNKWGKDQAMEYLLQLDAGMQGLTNNP